MRAEDKVVLFPIDIKLASKFEKKEKLGRAFCRTVRGVWSRH